MRRLNLTMTSSINRDFVDKVNEINVAIEIVCNVDSFTFWGLSSYSQMSQK